MLRGVVIHEFCHIFKEYEVLGALEPIFMVDFLRDPEEDEETGELAGPRPKIYETVLNLPALRERVQMFMEDYNTKMKVVLIVNCCI